MMKSGLPSLTQASLNGRSLDRVRKDFPLIASNQVIYLDNAATTQKPRSVIKALTDYYENMNANVHRGVYELSERATDAFEGARRATADFIGAPNPAGVIFTKNATEAINLVAYAWGENGLQSGDEVVITEMEHHSNIVPWQMLCRRKGAQLKYVPFDPGSGRPRWETLKKLLTSRTRLVAFSHVSNSLGTINPVGDIIKEVRRLSKALVLIDGAQGVPHFPVNVSEWDCDFLAFSAHKMLGPTGLGVLWGRTEILEGMSPFLGGGDMIKEVRMESSKWNELPWKFEAGTPNIADAIAFTKAIEYLRTVGLENIHRHELDLTRHALDGLSRMPGVTLYGTKTAPERCGIVSFNLGGMHPHDTGTLLSREGIAVRVGHHCNMPVMLKLGVMGTTRASFYLYNTIEEVDALLRAIPKVQKVFA